MRTTKYQPLADYLLNSGKDDLTLTFLEIETILGFELSPSHKKSRPNWSNNEHEALSKGWLNAGYRTYGVEIENGIVRFKKVGVAICDKDNSKQRIRSKTVEKIQRKKVDSVIIERMYAGGYLDENIGHEIINTFKSDSNRHFIYISPWGVVNAKYAHSKNILLVRGIAADIWEVIGYATNLELLLSDESLTVNNQKKTGEIDCQKQLNLIEERGIKYGGVAINELLREQKNVVFVTYEAKEYHSVKENKQLYLVSKKELIKGDNYIYLPTPKNKFGTQALHMYMDEENNRETYELLLTLLDDKQWWDSDTCHKIGDLTTYNETFNILEIIKKDDDELTFSNWLAYYLVNDSEMLYDFCKELLGIQIDIASTIVKREYKNIDIWIEDSNNILVIENKIKSGINGIVEERHDFSSEGIKSQLSKYVKIAEEESNGRQCRFKLLIPDHGVKDEELNVFSEYEKYLPVLRYSNLLSFVENHTTDLPYYEDFKKAIKKHASQYKKNLYQIMEERLIAKIKTKRS